MGATEQPRQRTKGGGLPKGAKPIPFNPNTREAMTATTSPRGYSDTARKNNPTRPTPDPNGR